MFWSPTPSEAACAEKGEETVVLVGLRQVPNCQEPLCSSL